MLNKSYLGLILPMISVLSFVGCSNNDDGLEEAAPVVRPIKLITVSEADAMQVNQFPAQVGANRSADLSFQVGGIIEELPINEAQQLNQGDLIAKLDQRDLTSTVNSARAQFESANTEYQRAVRLVEEDAIARSVLEQRKTQLDVAQSQLEQAEKALADSELRAPFNGVVAQKIASRLQTVGPGEPVISFISIDSLEATIDLPASYLANIPKDESGNDARKAFVLLEAAPNQYIEAEFKGASLLADTASQTYAITFSFRPPKNLLVLPGMNATVELRLENEEEGLRVAVPLDAISTDGENNFVWVVAQDTMTVSKRAVSIEDGVGASIVVTEGLQANDVIAGAGAAYLSEGMQVREWN